MEQTCWIVVVAVASQAAACSPRFTCEASRTCAPAGSSADEGGNSGEGGSDLGDGSSAGNHEAGGGAVNHEASGGGAGHDNADDGGTGDDDADGGGAGDIKSGIPRCGDGHIDQTEKCDDGTNNGPGKICNTQCQLNVCGDGDQGPREGCDNGAENGLELLRCAPDCSRIIELKHVIYGTKELPNSNLQPNPVAAADATCPIGYKAFFAYGTTRRATTTPYKALNSIDWVVRPYTYYYNDHENPLWLTDSVPLLGVRDGKFAALENTIAPYTAPTLTGLNQDYTTLGADNCQGWSSLHTDDSKRFGLPGRTDVGFMFYDTNECGDATLSFYCVEQ